jgi:hypothetical protein
MTTNSRATTKLTPEVHDSIVRDVRAGLPVSAATARAGLSRTALYYWEKRGESGEEPYAKFLKDVSAARADALGNRIERITAAGEMSACPTCTCAVRCVAPGDWKAHAWIGERLYPELQLTQKHDVHVTQKIEDIATAVRAHMSEGAFHEFVAAVAVVQGLDAPDVVGVVAEEARRLGSGD